MRSYMVLISGYRGVEIMKKLAMARACINSTGLYCLEAAGPIDGRTLELLERLQRRFARLLLGASRCAATETVTLDLNLSLIETQLNVRTVLFRQSLKNSKCGPLKKNIEITLKPGSGLWIHTIPWPLDK